MAQGLQLIGALQGLEDFLAERRAQALAAQQRQAAAQQQMLENAIKLEQLGISRQAAAPKPMALSPGQQLASPEGRILASAPFAPRAPQVLSPGAQLIGEGGGVLASAPFVPREPRPPQAPEEVGGFIYEPKGEGGGFVRTGPARNMSAEAAAVARAAGGAGGTQAYGEERTRRSLQSVAELKNLVTTKGRNVAGGVSGLMSWLPETDARSFRAQLDTLKANITFNELTEMREASKTGGALGQVSDREGALLGASLGALDPNQSPQQLAAQLDKIGGSLQRWQAAKSGVATPARTGASAETPRRRRYNPVTGTLE